jgi:spermidine synthase
MSSDSLANKARTNRAAIFLSFAMGFLSLSQEILWVRLFGFANQSTPKAFAFVLAIYLFGIAWGAWIGRLFCLRSSDLPRVVGIALIAIGFLDLLAPYVYVHYQGTAYFHAAGVIAIFLTAAGKSVLFPIAHHLGTQVSGARVGRSFSTVYAGNVFGATLGPLITGYVLLDYLSIGQAMNLITAGVGATAIWWLLIHGSPGRLAVSAALAVVGATIVADRRDPLLQVAFAADHTKTMIQNRAGVVHIVTDEKDGDVVFGGNVYDGRINLDVYRNSNLIHRTLAMSVLAPEAKRVLVIGLSTGAWLRLIQSFPSVEHIDVVEINPGYLSAISSYPELQRGITDPRVKLVIDDGRRWLRGQGEQRYDLIVMNTTWSWRAYASGLLSREFLELISDHMKSDSLLAFNSTVSPDAVKTASAVFAHAYRYENFVFASQADFRPRLTRANVEAKLPSLRWNDRAVLDRPPSETAPVVDRILKPKFETVSEVEASAGRPLEIITDHNLLPEYKFGRPLFTSKP